MTALGRRIAQMGNRVIGAALVASFLSLAGCDGSRPEPLPGSNVPAPSKGGVFRLAQMAPEGLDPARTDDTYEAAVINQLYDGLLSYDTNFNTMPCVAASWRISRDGLTYTFRLKEGVKFHDGSEVTAEDFVFSFERIFRFSPEEAPLGHEYLRHIEGVDEFLAGTDSTISGLEALGAYELRIRLKQPYASFLAVLASEVARVVPRDWVERNGSEALLYQPIGCGPFRLSQWVEDEHIVLDRFDDYHGQPPHLESLVIDTPRGSVREYSIEGFLAGRLDAVELTGSFAEDLSRFTDVVIHQRRELSLTYLAFDVTRPPFDDVRVRRAFSLAIDRDQLPGMGEGGRVAPNGILPPGFPGYSPEQKLPECNLEEAKRLLAEAGYPDGEGLPPILHGIGNRSPREMALANGVAIQVARVGFEMQTTASGWNEFDTALRARRYHAFTITWVADLPDPDAILYPLFHSQGSANFGGYHDVEVDAALEAARQGHTNGRRIDHYRDIERTIVTSVPVIVLNHTTCVFAVQRNVRDFSLSAMGMGNLPLVRVWLDGETPVEVAR